MPAVALDRVAVVRALDDVKAGSGPIAANRARAYGRSCFGWLSRRGAIEINAFDNIPPPAQERSRDRVLSDAELGAVWRSADRLNLMWRAILHLLVLTGQRRGEVAGLRWDELDLAAATWSLPAARTKNARAHTVPLAPAAVQIIKQIPRFAGCPLVLSNGRGAPPSGFGRVKLRLDELIANDLTTASDWTLHDLRRTVATGLQRLGTRLEVTEAVLNHVSGSRAGIVGIYQRHHWEKEKRDALDAWAGHVAACVGRPI
jgi:integrase